MIAGQADDAFHEMRMIQIRIFEDNDVAALKIAVGQKLFVPMAAAAENEFVDQEMIADKQRAFHGRRRNLESLDDETGAEEGENHRHQQ